MKKLFAGLFIAASLLVGSVAMAVNSISYSGGPIGFTDAVWNGSAWVGVDTHLDDLTVTADVATVGTYSLSDNNIHFAIDTLGTTETATLTGSFTTNNPIFYMYMAGVPAGCDMSVMKSITGDTMAVAWGGTDGFALTGDKSAVKSNVFGLGTTDFSLTCTLTVGDNQRAGHYELDPTIEIRSSL